MKTPNMSSITASLERDLQDISLDHHNSYSSCGSNTSGGGGAGGGGGGGSGGGLQENQHDLSNNTSQTTYDLNSHISLPYHWEQCLDLMTGDLYYINWRTGMKVEEDPRTAGGRWNDDFDEYSLEDDDDDDDSSSYGSEDSSAEEESHHSFSRNQCLNKIQCNSSYDSNERGDVLVVGGCKRCMMYLMVPKQVEHCPKCSGQLLHFDKPENASSS